MLKDKLKEIGFDENEAEIYIELLDNAGSTAGNLAKKVSIPRATLYDTLKRMVDKGVVLRTLRKGIRYFSAENPDKILQTLKIEVSKKERKAIEFEKLMPELLGLTDSKKSKTNIKIFEGVDAIKKILDDMLTYRDIESWSYWPISKMIGHLSADFFYHHNKMRIKNNIYTYAIWPHSEVINIKQFPYLGFGNEFKREIRVTPKNIKFVMGYWMYANKIAFISSKKEGYGVLIESKEMVEMMKTQHELVWQISTPITELPDEAIKYLMEIEKSKK